LSGKLDKTPGKTSFPRTHHCHLARLPGGADGDADRDGDAEVEKWVAWAGAATLCLNMQLHVRQDPRRGKLQWRSLECPFRPCQAINNTFDNKKT